MRPHNGWWKGTSAPRRWIDLVQEASQTEEKKGVQAQPVVPATVAGKVVPLTVA